MERDQASKFVNDLLRLLVSRGGSDLFLTADFPPAIKIDGKVTRVSPTPLTGAHTIVLARAIMNDKQGTEFESTKECNFAISPSGIGRFRVNAFMQQGHVGMVLRVIPNKLPNLDDLKLPPVLKEVAMTKRGLVIMVGATGSGKSTTLAAMVDWRNEHAFDHILTIEDPVEFIFKNIQSVVNQREVGSDTATMQVGLKNALRQAPDVILIGEIRDRETMSAAIAYAQSGHLCLATLHANNSYQALHRILNFYPIEVRAAMLGDLSSSLKAIMSQRLLRTESGSRIPAMEIMINTELIRELIEKGEFSEIREAIEKSMSDGSQTFEKDIARLIAEGKVSKKEGIAYADSPTNLLWRLQNDFTHSQRAAAAQAEKEEDNGPSFTEITLDVDQDE